MSLRMQPVPSSALSPLWRHNWAKAGLRSFSAGMPGSRSAHDQPRLPPGRANRQLRHPILQVAAAASTTRNQFAELGINQQPPTPALQLLAVEAQNVSFFDED
jgi:hypothetical protein